ncbi:steroid 17-alpha-hydroxylase/17,20 lyase-like [Anneissia japonica]|uniref:steroid 17-alpha-hydroxylase/17,20 lyase-like n=1 Tax=Anneissia japonica TaxID=1529436 RepID=UPI0014256A0A|nr:steroid 17-alpha-hydroxylase/17,20 lyase-like [Anneissia japonica]
MMEFISNTLAIFVVTVVLLITWIYMNIRRPPGMPPGPTPYPIIGNMPMLMGNLPPQILLMDSTKKYGPLISVKFGSFWSVVINSYELVQEALLMKPDDFSGRPHMYLNFTCIVSFALYLRYFSTKEYKMAKDIAFSQPTPTWKLHRKLAHTAIRKFATGVYLENLIDDVRPRLSDVMQSKASAPFDPKEIITLAVYNVIASMCFGRKYEFNDPELLRLIDLSKEVNEDLGNGTAADFIPWFRFFPNPTIKRVKATMSEFLDIISREVKTHLSCEEDRPANDLIDLLLQAQKEAKSEESIDANCTLTDVHIKQIVSDLFGAGTDTTTVTLLWGIGCLVDNPEIQEKIKTEIDEVIGDRTPRLSDRGKLPYTEATIMETMRFGTVLPLGVPHRAVTDSSIGSCRIPEDTWVFINHWALHNDPKYWDAPEEFRPERFLDSSHSIKQRLPSFLPFSTGRRVCVGEALAKAEVFLIFVWLIQNYKFAKPPGVEGPLTVCGNPQGLNFPKPYQVTAALRE